MLSDCKSIPFNLCYRKPIEGFLLCYKQFVKYLLNCVEKELVIFNYLIVRLLKNYLKIFKKIF